MFGAPPFPLAAICLHANGTEFFAGRRPWVIVYTDKPQDHQLARDLDRDLPGRFASKMLAVRKRYVRAEVLGLPLKTGKSPVRVRSLIESEA